MSSWARVGGAWSLNPEPPGAFFFSVSQGARGIFGEPAPWTKNCIESSSLG